jgi:hypothetical protein
MPPSNENNFVAQLGRISGKMLSENLLRNGIDLTVRDSDTDPDLLYLQVTDKKIGINTDTPIFTLDVNNLILSTDLISDQATIDNIVFESTAKITTVTGEINVEPASPNPTVIFDRLQAGNVVFNNNVIENVFLNQNLVFDPSGSGPTELKNDTNITGNLYTTGTITLDGNLSTSENIIIGNNITNDIITLLSNFQSDIKPSTDIIYDFGSGSLRWRDVYTQFTEISTSLAVNNVSISNPATISSTSGNLNFNLLGPDPQMNFSNGLSTPDFLIIGNKISGKLNKNVNLEASGVGIVLFNNDTNFLTNLNNTGNTTIIGNFFTNSNITLGDNLNDTVSINVSLDQDILPGTTLTLDLGSSTNRWDNAYIPDWTKITTISPQTALVGNNMQLGGTNNIIPLIGNSDFILTSGTGIYDIERIRFQENDITNLDNTPLTLTALGIGYYVIEGDNGFVIPAGTTAERPISPTQASTRWNTDLEYIECFDSITQTWRRSIGSGDVNIDEMEDYSFFYTIILG